MNILTLEKNFLDLQVDSLSARVGNTPLLPLRRVTLGLPPSVKIYAKAEWFNPGGSIKDRAALNIIRTAIAKGELTANKRLLDSTSGNTGIAYATFGAAMGIPITLALPENASKERIAILNALGVELILTDALEGPEGSMQVVREMLEKSPEKYFYANQYGNPANWMAHYNSTGPEIYAQTAGQITHFVAGLGTSGTMMGTGRYLRDQNPQIKLIAGQPTKPLHGLEGLKHMKSAEHPAIYEADLSDRYVEVETEAAHEMVRRLAREEGLFVGLSSGAAAIAALRVAEELDEGTVVTIFPDAGYKYLSHETLWNDA
ncbi:MAG: cysteine synthase family protein [Anaerolineae bacterium]|jgi:cysteine synthase B|nr:cysteine synthase family protein [Anaerolineae bacterium]MBT4311930.1 cysteine synthase family protein [Anaerolineae bacterium]MBT4459605.1 cysteine synthase family protein [Anaerolineae bacterium]MBT4841638.1 cysteine synthase family protein [Anaerolineae bacterium]MBT6060179.1 cysteine synthase family protein [Anaerolineae bacterium]